MERLMTLAKENGFSHWAPANLSAFRPLPPCRRCARRTAAGSTAKTGPARRGAAPWPGQRRRFAGAAAAFWCRPPVPWPMNLITRVCSAWPGSTKKPLRALPGRPGCCIRTAWPLRQGPAPFAADVPAHRPLAATRPGGCRPWRPMACGSAIYAANRAWNIITAHRP